MPFVVATCTQDYEINGTEPIAHKDEDISVPIEDKDEAIRFAVEAVKMTCLLYDMFGEHYEVMQNGPLLVVHSATRMVSFGIKSF